MRNIQALLLMKISSLVTPWRTNLVVTTQYSIVKSICFSFGLKVCTSWLLFHSWFPTSSTWYIRMGRLFTFLQGGGRRQFCKTPPQVSRMHGHIRYWMWETRNGREVKRWKPLSQKSSKFFWNINIVESPLNSSFMESPRMRSSQVAVLEDSSTLRFYDLLINFWELDASAEEDCNGGLFDITIEIPL